MPRKKDNGKTLWQLNAELQALKLQAEQVRLQEGAAVAQRIRREVELYGLEVVDVFPALAGQRVTVGFPTAPKAGKPALKKKPGPVPGLKRRPKYRDSDTGETWTGAGARPRWLRAKVEAGHAIEEFLI